MKTFGKFGPAYEAVGIAGQSTTGKNLVTIRVLQTGMVTDYEVDAMMEDPEAK